MRVRIIVEARGEKLRSETQSFTLAKKNQYKRLIKIKALVEKALVFVFRPFPVQNGGAPCGYLGRHVCDSMVLLPWGLFFQSQLVHSTVLIMKRQYDGLTKKWVPPEGGISDILQYCTSHCGQDYLINRSRSASECHGPKKASAPRPVSMASKVQVPASVVGLRRCIRNGRDEMLG